MSRKKIRVGIIGAGRIANLVHVPSLKLCSEMCEVLAVLPGTAYLERVSVHKPAAIVKAKKAIRKAFEHQLKGTGFSMVEILSPCPTNWHMGALESCKWVEDVMSKQFPLGLVKEVPC